MQIPESIRTLIESGPQVHLTTLNANGRPQVTLMVRLEEDPAVQFALRAEQEPQSRSSQYCEGFVALADL